MKTIVSVTTSILSGIAAVTASSCCAISLLLFSFGVSGAWATKLSVLQPYHYHLAILSLLLLIGGNIYYFKGRKKCCNERNRIVDISLIVSTVISLVLIGASVFWTSMERDIQHFVQVKMEQKK